MTHTSARVWQWTGIILILCLFGGAYWYFKVYGSTLNQSQNDLNTNGLVGLWSFNGDDISGVTAYDRSGSGNNGTLTNGPVATQGKVGQAFDFDGTNDYVSTADYSYSNAQAFTMSVWFKADTVSGNQVIFSKTTYEYNLRLTDATLAFAYWDTGGVGAIDLSYSRVAANRWYLVDVTYDGSGAAYMYVDGVRVASDTNIVNSFQNKAEALLIGGGYHISGNPGYLNGQIDEMRVYNRALSAGEIQSLYAAGGGTKIDSAISQPQGTGRLDSGLAGYWKLDEGSGTSATDSSTNGYTGTLTNGPTWTTGQIGGDVDLDGTNDYITMGDQSVHEGMARMTLSGWIKMDALPASTYMPISKSSAIGQYRFTIDSSGNPVFVLATTNNAWYSSGTYAGGSTALTTSTWIHLLGTYDGQYVRIYVNGVLAGTGSQAISGSIVSNVSNFQIGYDSFGNYFNGQIDEVRLYNRELSSDEVSQLYRLTAPTSVDTGLEGYWSFNGKDVSGTTAFDRSGAGNTGTLTGGPSIAEGKLAQGLNFDGSDDYVSVADAAAFTQSALTVSFWKKETNASLNRALVTKAGTGNRSWSIEASSAAANIKFITSSSSVSESEYGVTPNIMSPGIWYHVVCVFNGAGSGNSGRMQIYINGVSQSLTFTGTIPASLVDNSQILSIGGKDSVGGYLGSIDEVRVYNRALSAGEAKGLYDVGADDKTNSSVSQPQGTGRLDSGLTGYWKMDDGSGTSATDSSANGNNAGFINTPTWTTGQIGGALDFTDPLENQSLSVGDVLDMPDGANFSVAGWFYRSTFNTVDIIFAKTAGLGAGYTGYGVYIDDASDALVFLGADGTDIYTLTSSSTFTGTGWNHFVAVWNDTSANGTKLYINGKLESATASGTFANVGSMSNVDPIHIGSESDIFTSNDRSFRGKLDEVRIYNRALSADEVAQLYRLNTPTGTDTGLKGYWSFNGKDMSGTTAYDRSGAGNTGTLTNGPTIAEGKIGQGLSFDGTDDYVTGNIANVPMGNTVSLWFRANNVTGNKVLFSHDDNTNTGQRLNLLGSGSSLYFTLGGVADYDCGLSAVVANTWYFFAATTTGDGGTVTCYLGQTNGTFTAGSSVAIGTRTGTPTKFNIGARNGGNNLFSGTIDETRIYNRALTEAEIKSLYNTSR